MEKVKSLTNLPFAFPVRDHQASCFRSMANIMVSHLWINKTSTSDFHQITSPRTITFDVCNDPVAPIPSQRAGASVVAKEGTGVNTHPTPDTETTVENAIRQKKKLYGLFESLPHALRNTREVTQISHIWTILSNCRSGLINSQKLMLCQRQRYMLFYTRWAFFKIIKHIQLSECHIMQLNILMNFF